MGIQQDRRCEHQCQSSDGKHSDPSASGFGKHRIGNVVGHSHIALCGTNCHHGTIRIIDLELISIHSSDPFVQDRFPGIIQLEEIIGFPQYQIGKLCRFGTAVTICKGNRDGLHGVSHRIGRIIEAKAVGSAYRGRFALQSGKALCDTGLAPSVAHAKFVCITFVPHIHTVRVFGVTAVSIRFGNKEVMGSCVQHIAIRCLRFDNSVDCVVRHKRISSERKHAIGIRCSGPCFALCWRKGAIVHGPLCHFEFCTGQPGGDRTAVILDDLHSRCRGANGGSTGSIGVIIVNYGSGRGGGIPLPVGIIADRYFYPRLYLHSCFVAYGDGDAVRNSDTKGTSLYRSGIGDGGSGIGIRYRNGCGVQL